MLYVYVNENCELTGIKNGIDTTSTDMIVPFPMLRAFGRPELLKMLKSLEPETTLSVASPKETVMGQLMVAAASQVIEPIRASQPPTSRRSQSTNKDRCFVLFDEYNIENKSETLEATNKGMELCGMAEDDFRGRRVIQTYLSYYRTALRDGLRPNAKTVI